MIGRLWRALVDVNDDWWSCFHDYNPPVQDVEAEVWEPAEPEPPLTDVELVCVRQLIEDRFGPQ